MTSSTERIQRILADYWALPSGSAQLPPALRAGIRQSDRGNSSSASAPTYAGRPPVFVKLLPSTGALEAEQQGWLIARTLAGTDGRVRVPAVLATMPSERAIIMEYIAGTNLTWLLRRTYLMLPDACISIVRRLGHWLATYHQTGRGNLSQAELLNRRAERTLGYLQEVTALLSQSRLAQVREILETIIEKAAQKSLRTANCHGDFHIKNVIVRDKDLYVVDFAASGGEFPEKDLIGFRWSLWNAIGSLPFSNRTLKSLYSAFIDGYCGQEPVGFDREIANLLQLEAMVQAVALHARCGQYSALRRLWRIYLMKQYLSLLVLWLDGDREYINLAMSESLARLRTTSQE